MDALSNSGDTWRSETGLYSCRESVRLSDMVLKLMERLRSEGVTPAGAGDTVLEETGSSSIVSHLRGRPMCGMSGSTSREFC